MGGEGGGRTSPLSFIFSSSWGVLVGVGGRGGGGAYAVWGVPFCEAGFASGGFVSWWGRWEGVGYGLTVLDQDEGEHHLW